jgi:hypothetical protein
MTSLRLILVVLTVGLCQSSIVGGDATKARIEVLKSQRQLHFFQGERLIKSYRIALGTNPKPALRRFSPAVHPTHRVR